MTVNPSKTQLVAFTKKKKLYPPIEVSIFGEKIELTDEAKYMGVVLDSKLTWKPHVEKISNKGSNLLWMCRRAVGQKWGLKPKVAHWLYVTVVRPALTYASVVWWRRTEVFTSAALLSKVQRQALLLITGAMNTTPTATMEALLQLPSLDLVVKAEARAAIHRLQTLNLWRPNRVSTSHTIFKNSLAETNILAMGVDAMVPTMVYMEKIKFVIPDRGSHAETTRGIQWYTDGSKTDSGAGVGVYGKRPRVNFYASLGRYTSVFQTEVFALLICAEMNLRRGYKGRPITMFTDSQAAIKALETPITYSKLVKNCKDCLNRLARVNQVTISWVPGHEGIEGNEIADQLAKKGAESCFIGPEPAVGVSKQTCRQEIRDWLERKQTEQWRSAWALNHSKKFIKAPSKKTAKEVLLYEKRTLKTIVEMITGHCRLMKHLHTLGIKPEPDCRKCGMEEETAFHVLCECPAVMAARTKLYGKPLLLAEEVMEEPLWKIARFIGNTGLLE